MEKEQAQKIVNDFLKGKSEVVCDFDFIENEELAIYEIKQAIEGMDFVFLTFPAKEHYKEAKERYYEERSEESSIALEEMVLNDLEDIYDYENPTSLVSPNGNFHIENGVVQ